MPFLHLYSGYPRKKGIPDTTVDLWFSHELFILCQQFLYDVFATNTYKFFRNHDHWTDTFYVFQGHIKITLE